MKKMIIIIVILLIIFIGMLIYRNQSVRENNQISVQEIEQIETYITKIYMWKEVTGEALPVFENINEAEDVWIWEVVKKNLEEYELGYNQIQEKAKEIFGQDFTKEFPKQGTENFTYDEQTDKYYATGMGLDQEEDCFLLNQINKTQTGYEVEIVEYLEDYSQENIVEELQEQTGSTGVSQQIIIKNLNDQEISRIDENQEGTSKDVVKNNIEKFTKKIVTLKKEGDNLYVQKVSNAV